MEYTDIKCEVTYKKDRACLEYVIQVPEHIVVQYDDEGVREKLVTLFTDVLSKVTTQVALSKR